MEDFQFRQVRQSVVTDETNFTVRANSLEEAIACINFWDCYLVEDNLSTSVNIVGQSTSTSKPTIQIMYRGLEVASNTPRVLSLEDRPKLSKIEDFFPEGSEFSRNFFLCCKDKSKFPDYFILEEDFIAFATDRGFSASEYEQLYEKLNIYPFSDDRCINEGAIVIHSSEWVEGCVYGYIYEAEDCYIGTLEDTLKEDTTKHYELIKEGKIIEYNGHCYWATSVLLENLD